MASEIDNLDPNQAYIMGLIHDIGRVYGITQERHSIDGYYFLKEKSYDELAKICITHCFPNKNVDAAVCKWDCTDTELIFVKELLADIEYDDYDRLIQLFDCLIQHDKYVLMEKRLFNVALRYHLKNQSDIKLCILERWEKYLKLRDYFNQKIGRSIYTLLPDVIKNTFD
ncbi:MAG: HD domain-containing protein [Candidatus Hodarchaeota archaeon]